MLGFLFGVVRLLCFVIADFVVEVRCVVCRIFVCVCVCVARLRLVSYDFLVFYNTGTNCLWRC